MLGLERVVVIVGCVGVLACAVLSGGSRAAAQAQAVPNDDAEARSLFEQGRDAFQAARYELALDLFKQAYELSKRPQLLNNIAAAADRLRMDKEALDAYRRFLAEVPDAENRAMVENRIATLEQSLARTVPTPAQTAQAAPQASAPGPLATPSNGRQRDESSDGSVFSSWWLWAGVSMVAVAAGVIVAVAATNTTETVDGPTPIVDRGTRVIEL